MNKNIVKPMKFSLLLMGLLMTSLLYSQEKSELPQGKALKIQGSYFFDGHSDGNYTGFENLTIGWMKVSGQRVKGLDLEGISFVSPLNRAPGGTNWSRNKRSLELGAYSTYAVLGDFRNGLYLGPLVSLGFVREELMPSLSTGFPDGQSLFKIGAGAKADYYLGLSKKIFLNISTKLTLLDFGILSGRVENPALPISQQKYGGFDFNLIRPQFPLMFGFVFLLGK